MKVTQFAMIFAVVATMTAIADEAALAPRPVRTIFERHDQSNVTPAKEIVIGSAALPAGSGIGFHTHPGDESGYVVKGTLILKTKGQADRTLKVGDSFFNPRGAIHSLVTAPGGEGGVAVSTWIIDKGQPLASPTAQ